VRITSALSVGLLFVTCSSAQNNREPLLRLTINPDKIEYALNETVLVHAELTNISKTTLCFPRPAQDCAFAPTGSLLTTGEPVTNEREESFTCHMDGVGKHGRALDEAVKNDWVKLQPGEVYAAKPAKAFVNLDESGQWKLTAAYEPPEGSFSREYRNTLKTAAAKAGCKLPEDVVVAEPRLIIVGSKPSESQR
jgi:hypothetical protein